MEAKIRIPDNERPTLPCESCWTDSQAAKGSDIALVIYCAHNQSGALRFRTLNTLWGPWQSYSPVSPKQWGVILNGMTEQMQRFMAQVQKQESLTDDLLAKLPEDRLGQS